MEPLPLNVDATNNEQVLNCSNFMFAGKQPDHRLCLRAEPVAPKLPAVHLMVPGKKRGKEHDLRFFSWIHNLILKKVLF